MIKNFIILLFCLVARVSPAQTFFEYDPAGNRIKRFSIPVPDLVAIVQVSPSNAYGVTPVIAKLRVNEVNGASTSGPITVRLTKNSKISFNFDPTTSSIGGTSVQNSNWSFDSSNSSYYILTSNAVIAGVSSSVIGLSGTITPNNLQGLLTISIVIEGGSGGELKSNNNTAAAKVDYFPQ